MSIHTGQKQKIDSRQFHLVEEAVRVQNHRSVFPLCKAQIRHLTVVRTSGKTVHRELEFTNVISWSPQFRLSFQVVLPTNSPH